MKNHREILSTLLQFQSDLRSIESNLSSLEWDSVEIITLSKDHLINVLERYLSSNLSAQDVENWANLIEGRDDIAYAENQEDLVKKSITELANPILYGVLTPEIAENIIKLLGK